MGMNDHVIKELINDLEIRAFWRTFPKELELFLLDRYGEDPWPHEYTKDDLSFYILRDTTAYFYGKLDITIKSPLEKAQQEILELRSMYGDAMRELLDLEEYLNEVHELLWSKGVISSRMIPNESGIFEGTYAEHNSLDNLEEKI